MRLRINSPSDDYPGSQLWRDDQVRKALSTRLSARGHAMVTEDPEVDLWLCGWMVRTPDPAIKNIVWLMGHPDRFLEALPTLETLPLLRIFCASQTFAAQLAAKGLDAHDLPCPPPDRPRITYSPKYALAFVGNADPRKRRPMLRSCFNEFPSLVIGQGWGDDYAEFTDWDGLHLAWNQARIVPYTHHMDMAREGFVAEAALDVMANSGALLLSDHNHGWENLGIPVPQWKTEAELRAMIVHYLEDERDRARLALECQEKARELDYEHAATVLESAVGTVL
ncbi:MAG: CgeB family protein [Planctomycetota bacterium]|jgi:hypothetical protein